MINFKNKVILITGATGGIGNSLVKKFNNLDATVIATGTNEEKLINLKKNYPNIQTEKFKLDDHNMIGEFVEKIDKKFGRLDVLVNNAGITLDNLSIRLTEENWKKVIDINLTSSFLMCKHVIKKMLKKKIWQNHKYNIHSWTYWQFRSSELCSIQSRNCCFFQKFSY